MSSLKPWGMATAIGSLPFCDPEEAVGFVLEHLPHIPHWPQLPRRGPAEGMMRQYTGPLVSQGLLEERGGSLAFPTGREDWVENLTAFYEKALPALEGDTRSLDFFALPPEGAAGFYAFKERLGIAPHARGAFVKGQVTGPVTLGLQLTDGEKRPCFYSRELRALLLETLALQALWQVRELKQEGLPVIIFFDDPSLYSYGQSATVGLSGEDITAAYAYLGERLRAAGALTGVHACAGVEWSLVLKAGLDIINADTFQYFPSLLAAAGDLGPFLEKGGTLAWGIVPTGREGGPSPASSLWEYFQECCEKLAGRGAPLELLKKQWLLTPACGTGSRSREDTAYTYKVLRDMADNPPEGIHP